MSLLNIHKKFIKTKFQHKKETLNISTFAPRTVLAQQASLISKHIGETYLLKETR